MNLIFSNITILEGAAIASFLISERISASEKLRTAHGKAMRECNLGVTFRDYTCTLQEEEIYRLLITGRAILG